jgi:tripartite-type tricarboxylate transporter receptor subunit TctC
MKKSLAILAVALAVAPAHAAYPDRPIKLIVPWGAGGDTDVIYRTFQQDFQKRLGGTVADVNWTDFQPICLVTATPSILTASPKAPWADMKAMLADAKAKPGTVAVGATLGSTSHFFPAMVARAAGIKFKYVSYEGTAARMNALLGSHIDLAESNLTQKGKADAGQMKFLAVATEKRMGEVPDVPTLKELGVDVEYAVNRGLVAPKGTPADIMAKLGQACGGTATTGEFAAQMKKHGTVVRYLDAKGYTAFLEKNDALNKELAKELGMLKR